MSEEPPVSPVLSVDFKNNASLIAEAGRLYIEDGARVADVTWGKGAFWSKFDLSRIQISKSDLMPREGMDDVTAADFRSLPYDDGSMDVVVLDPPYIHNPGNHVTDPTYNNAATTKGFYHDDIRALYVEGMREATRVLADGGQVWVKCKDQVESGVQRWSHVELYSDAIDMGLFARDLFVLAPHSKTAMGRWKRQIHARKTHSYLWIFEKPTPKNIKSLIRAKIFPTEGTPS